MKYAFVLLVPLLSAPAATAFAGNCPAATPTSRGNGQVAGISGAGGLEYYFVDAEIANFDCFRRFSQWFPAYMQVGTSVSPQHQVVDMAYAHDATATFYNVVAKSAGPHTLTIRYAYAKGLFPGVPLRGEGVRVNGTVLTSAMAFPMTGNFDKFETASIVADLKAGANTIQLLNLNGASISRTDTLTVAPVTAGACATPPPAPTAVDALASSATQVNLNWSASAAPKDCSVHTYDVFRTSNLKLTPSGDNKIAFGLTSTAYDDKTALCNMKYYYSIAANDQAGPSVPADTVAVRTEACPATSAVRIKSGGPAVSAFKADADFTGGTPQATPDPITTINVPAGLPMELFETSREGNFSYAIKGFSPKSTHKLSLDFIEPTFNGVGLRKFDVSINGKKVLTNFDIFLTAGDNDTPWVEKFTEAADASGEYLIAFTPVLAGAIVSGLEIE